MPKKMKLEDLQVKSFVTLNKEDRNWLKGAGSTNRACPTAYACPTEYPVCTHPYVTCPFP